MSYGYIFSSRNKKLLRSTKGPNTSIDLNPQRISFNFEEDTLILMDNTRVATICNYFGLYSFSVEKIVRYYTLPDSWSLS